MERTPISNNDFNPTESKLNSMTADAAKPGWFRFNFFLFTVRIDLWLSGPLAILWTSE